MIDVMYVINYLKNTVIHHIFLDRKNLSQGDFFKKIGVYDLY
tara:strand:- start:647 stop:772 length:126 start_codon:yes stop_codon:yes gene_type:complete